MNLEFIFKVIDKEFVKDIMCVAPKYGEKLIQTFHKESFRGVNINLLLEQEKYNDAIIWFKKALELNPNSCQVLNNIGNIYQTQRKFEYAIKSFNKAISISPNNIDALNNLGVTHQHLGNSFGAINAFIKVIFLEPNSRATDFENPITPALEAA